MDLWSLLHPSLTNPAGVPHHVPQTKQSQALLLNCPDKHFALLEPLWPHRPHSWCWEFLPGTSKRAGLNSSFEAQPRSLSLGKRRSHENSSETSAASKHICLPWELKSALQTHLPPAPAKLWRPWEFMLPEMSARALFANCTVLRCLSPSYSTSHSSSSYCILPQKLCQPKGFTWIKG